MIGKAGLPLTPTQLRYLIGKVTTTTSITRYSKISTAYTISFGAIALDFSYNAIIELGAGSILQTITGGTAGQALILMANDPSSNPVKVQEGGNIKLMKGAPFNLNEDRSNITLVFDGTYWFESSRAAIGS